jgi:nitrilase
VELSELVAYKRRKGGMNTLAFEFFGESKDDENPQPNSKNGAERGRSESQTLKVAIAQFAPVYLDKAASLSRAIQMVQDAKKRGAELVAFGETWLPGYPAWLDVCPNAALWEHLPTKQVFARLRQNSVTIPGPEVAALCEAAGDLKINVVMGVNERVEAGPGNGTLYNSLLTITPEAQLANHHRKLVPTYTERLIWGNATVAD